MKKLLYIALIILFIFLIYVLIYNLKVYQGNKFIYFLFSIISFYFVISIFFEKKYFCEIFLGIYLWLGYWWKFSILQFINKSEMIYLSRSEGFPPSYLEPDILNDVFFSLIVAFLALILSFKVYKLIFKDYTKNNFDIEENFFSILYFENKKKIIFLYIILFLFISFTNYHFGIYQKGLATRSDIHPLIVNIYKWLILFGVSFFGSVILYYELRNTKKNIFWLSILVLFENLLISASNLSRAMIVNSSSIIYGLQRNLKNLNFINNFNLLIKLILILFLFFFISFTASVELRKKSVEINILKTQENLKYETDKNLYEKNKNFIESLKVPNYKSVETNENIENSNSLKIYKLKDLYSKIKKISIEMTYLITKRWVGIDSMIIVSDNENRNFKYLLKSFKDKPSNKNSYYEINFVRKFLINQNKLETTFPNRDLNIYNNTGQRLIGVITPGFISFLNYANNKLFLFSSLFITGILLMTFERITSFFSRNNLILVSFLTHIVIYRLIHFGHLPHQSYLLFGTLLSNLIIFYFLKKIYFKIKSK